MVIIKSSWLVIVLALAVGVLYAAPQFLILKDLERSDREFILNSFIDINDESYFYLQHAREVYDGHFPPKDFFLEPEDQRPSIANKLPPAIFALFIYLTGGNIHTAYIFANLIIPTALFAIFYLIGQIIFEKNRIWSLFLAFSALFTAGALHMPRLFFGLDNFLNLFINNFYPGVRTLLPKLFFTRIDYPLITYLVYLPAILSLLVFWKKPNWRNALITGIFSGLLFHTYFHFWAYWATVLGLALVHVLIFLRRDKERLRGLLIVVGVAALFSIPVFVSQIQFNLLDVTGEFAARIGHLVERGRFFRWSAWPHYLFYLVLAAAIYWIFWKKSDQTPLEKLKDYRIGLFLIFLLAGFIAWNAQLATGLVPVSRHWARAISPLLFFITFALVYEILKRAWRARPKVYRAIAVCLVVLMILAIAKKTVNALAFVSSSEDFLVGYTLPRGITDAYQWLENNGGREPRVVSPSFITSMHLTGLTSARPILQYSVIASLTNAEAEYRYLSVNKLFGVSEKTLEARLRGGAGIECFDCRYPYQKQNITEDETNLYNVYFRDLGFKGIPDDKIESLLSAYRALKVNWKAIPADYVYYGPLERVFSQKDFSSDRGLELAYKNDLVEVYKIK